MLTQCYLSFTEWTDFISLFLSVKCLSTNDTSISELESAGNISSEKAIGCTGRFHKTIVSSSHAIESSFHYISSKKLQKAASLKGHITNVTPLLKSLEIV